MSTWQSNLPPARVSNWRVNWPCDRGLFRHALDGCILTLCPAGMEPLRIIYEIEVELMNGYQMAVELDRNGNAIRRAGAAANDGRPREKHRTIDLRRGDEVMRYGRWCKIRRIRSLRSELVAAEIIHRLPRNDGYIYRLKK